MAKMGFELKSLVTPNPVLLEINIRGFNRKMTENNLIYVPPSLIINILLPRPKVITCIAGVPPPLEGEVGSIASMHPLLGKSQHTSETGTILPYLGFIWES